MDRLRLLSFAIAAAAAAGMASACAAQTRAVEPVAPYPAKTVPSGTAISYPAKPVSKVETLMPFAEDNAGAAMDRLIGYLSADRMSEADRALAAKMLPAIRDAASQAGMEFGKAQWSYRQLECQAAPNHLFLLFESGGGGDASLFSASIPRAGKGHLRIVPVERRGYSLYRPAPVSALALATYNLIRAEEPKEPRADWLATSLCYAALTAPRGAIALWPRDAPGANPGLYFPPSIAVGERGESTVRFVNAAAARGPMQWALTFDAQGQLLRVDRTPAPVYATRIVPKN